MDGETRLTSQTHEDLVTAFVVEGAESLNPYLLK